jgi:hypothetical protein
MAVAHALAWWLLLTGVGSLIAWKHIARRRLVGLAVGNTICTFIAYNLILPSSADIRADLFLTGPVVLVIIGLGVKHRSRRASTDIRTPPPDVADGR